MMLAAALAWPAPAEVRVQDIARLQGQRTNPLMGYGLVVGLTGTGDSGKSPVTVRALMAMHKRFAQDVLLPEDLKNVSSVALVAVEASIPEFGAREGQRIDLTVSTVGDCKSLRGGRLLTTPLQYAMFRPGDSAEDRETQRILALAGGRIELTDANIPTAGTIRGGATLESDFYYTFILDDAITLVLLDTQAGYPMAQAVARAVNHELARPASGNGGAFRTGNRGAVTLAEIAVAEGPTTVRVQIPDYEREQPSSFISRVLETPIFAMPDPEARVTINRTDRQVSFNGRVTVSPTVLLVPGLGSVTVGAPGPAADPNTPNGGRAEGTVPFDELLKTLTRASVPPDQIIKTVEQLHSSGAIHARLIYKD